MQVEILPRREGRRGRSLPTVAGVPSSPLTETLAAAGATFVDRSCGPVAAHFGSVIGELAVCLSAVGIADRSNAPLIELRGDATAIARVAARATGRELAPRHAARGTDAWWCAVTPNRFLVVGDRPCTPDLASTVEAAARQAPGASTMALTGHYAVIAVLGPHASDTVRAAELVSGPVPYGTFLDRCGAPPVMLLRHEPEAYLILAPRARGVAAWRTLIDAGRPFGATCVGDEALDRLGVATALAGQRRAGSVGDLTP